MASSALFALALLFGQATLPVVEEVEWAPLREQSRRLLRVLADLKAPLPEMTASQIASLLDKPPAPDQAVREVQRLLDGRCLVAVSINPESRVKAARGPAPVELVLDRPAYLLVKVYNEAGVTHPLAVAGPQLAATGLPREPGRWLEAEIIAPAPLARKLSGQRLEYVVLRLIPHEAGKREATLRFDVGQGTQDLGFRAETPILFTVRTP